MGGCRIDYGRAGWVGCVVGVGCGGFMNWLHGWAVSRMETNGGFSFLSFFLSVFLSFFLLFRGKGWYEPRGRAKASVAIGLGVVGAGVGLGRSG